MNPPLPEGIVERLTLGTLGHAGAGPDTLELALVSTSSLADGRIEAFRAWLSEEELARADRFVKSEDRVSFVAAHALLRIELRRRFPDIMFPAIIETGEHGGKPRLAQLAHGIDFNISHTTGLVACVTAQGVDVGVDCESLERTVSADLAETSFSAAEQAWLRQQQQMAAGQAFLHVWTLKEAVSKAAGLGLGIDFGSFTVLPAPARMMDAGPHLQSARRWELWQAVVDGGFVVAVAARHQSHLNTERIGSHRAEHDELGKPIDQP